MVTAAIHSSLDMRPVFNSELRRQIIDTIMSAGSEGIYIYRLPAMFKVSAARLLRFIEMNIDTLFDVKSGKVIGISRSKPLSSSASVTLRSGRKIPVPDHYCVPPIAVSDFYMPSSLAERLDKEI